MLLKEAGKAFSTTGAKVLRRVSGTKLKAMKGARFAKVLDVTREALDGVRPFILACYEVVNGENDDAQTKKDDGSFFSMADGSVQILLTQFLYRDEELFRGIVGEEDLPEYEVNTRPYVVGGIEMPPHVADEFDKARSQLEQLSKTIKKIASSYTVSSTDADNGGGDSDMKKKGGLADVTIFIDPIDGTREFCTGLGHESTVLVGFAVGGAAVAGIIYRPISSHSAEKGMKSIREYPAQWVLGCPKEGLSIEYGLGDDQSAKSVESGAWKGEGETNRGFVVSRSRASDFLKKLGTSLGQPEIKAGVVVTKPCCYWKGKADVYVQDGGMSRWDTCAPEAVVKAAGGCFYRLDGVVQPTSEKDEEPSEADRKGLMSYQYKVSTENADFVAGISNISPYNAAKKGSVKKGDPPRKIRDKKEILPYSNILGAFVLSPNICKSKGDDEII